MDKDIPTAQEASAPLSEPTLKYLKLAKTGPAETLEAEFAPRVNLFTGDNGLGKTFLLDCAWWALTGLWANEVAAQPSASRGASIEFAHINGDEPRKSAYAWINQAWRDPTRKGLSGLFLYVGVDGSFSYSQNFNLEKYRPSDQRIFTNDRVWYGYNEPKDTPKSPERTVIRGLMVDSRLAKEQRG
jgi:hypothetical protein